MPCVGKQVTGGASDVTTIEQKETKTVTALKMILYFLFIFLIFGITIGLIDVLILRPLGVIPKEFNFLYGIISFLIAGVFTWRKMKQGGFHQDDRDKFTFK